MTFKAWCTACTVGRAWTSAVCVQRMMKAMLQQTVGVVALLEKQTFDLAAHEVTGLQMFWQPKRALVFHARTLGMAKESTRVNTRTSRTEAKCSVADASAGDTKKRLGRTWRLVLWHVVARKASTEWFQRTAF